MSSSNYVHSQVCSEVFKWYLEKSSEPYVVNFGGCITLKTSTLLLLIGAGGVGIGFYLLNKDRYSRDDEDNPNARRKSRFGPFNWLFDGELVKGGIKQPDTLHHFHFPHQPSPKERMKERNLNLIKARSNSDTSLNCILSKGIEERPPKRFLQCPLFDVNQNRMSTFSGTCNTCPKCVQGTCRIKRHGCPIASSSTRNALDTSFSGDPKMSAHEEFSKCTTASKVEYCPHAELYDTRGAPDGQEQWSMLSSSHGLPCNDSIQSIAMSQGSISGSMIDLIINAREARRLIREASFDSTASDLCIRFNTSHTYPYDDSVPSQSQPVSFYLSETDATNCSRTESETMPDLRDLDKSLQFSKTPWMLTDFPSTNEVPGVGERSRQTSVLSDIFLERDFSGASFDQWEWDNDGCTEDEDNTNNIDPDQLENLMKEYPFLQGTQHKYEKTKKETDYKSSDHYRSRTSPKSEQEMSLKVRLPPPGQSSVESDHQTSHNLASPNGIIITCGDITTMDTKKEIDAPTYKTPHGGEYPTNGCTKTIIWERLQQIQDSHPDFRP